MENVREFLDNAFTNIREFFHSPSSSRTLVLIGLIILAVALPVTVIVLQQTTQYRQSAFIDCSGDWVQCAGDSGLCTSSSLAHHSVHVYQPQSCKEAPTCVDLGVTIGKCGYNPSNKCANGAGTCYTNNSCGSGSHEVDNGGCATGYRICCVPNPVTPTPTPFVNTCLQTAGNKCAPANQGCDTLGAYSETTGTCDIYHRQACCRPKSCGVGYTWDDSQHKCTPTSCTAAGDKCYVNNSCGAGQHEVTDSSHSCTSTDNAGRICCAAGPVICDTIGQVCCPGSVCSNGLYCDPINVTCQAAKGYECANDGNQGAGKNEIVDGGTRISFTPKKYCPQNYFCTVNHNLITSHQAPNGRWYSTSDSDICQPIYTASHPYPGDTCASVNGPGVCLMATNSYPYFNTYRDNTCLIPGPQVCNVRPVPDCAQVLPGTVTNRDKETQACPWNGGHDYKCCVYTSGITCSKIIAGGVCPIALTGNICPPGYHDSGASHPDSFCPIGGHSCCVPDAGATSTCTAPDGRKGTCYTNNSCGSNQDQVDPTGSGKCNPASTPDGRSYRICCVPKAGTTTTPGGGGGGGGGGCTNGQDTKLAISVKLDGIGTTTFENNDPAHPNRTGKVRVFDTSNSNGSVNNSSQAFNHGKGNGKFDSATIDVGNKLSCTASYKVELKLPGYLPATADVKYGDTTQVANLEPLPGDINQVDNNGVIVGDGSIDVNDYSIYRQCRNVDPNTPIPFSSGSNTVNVKCGDLINFFDFQDGGTMENIVFPASGIGEWDANYNLWLRSYIKANGY